jgi:hypothetical protein
MNFRMLPEYMLEDIADYHVFLMSYVGSNPRYRCFTELKLIFASLLSCRHRPQSFDNSDQTKLITFVVTFLSGAYVKNPFVKSKLVEVSLLSSLLLFRRAIVYRGLLVRSSYRWAAILGVTIVRVFSARL